MKMNGLFFGGLFWGILISLFGLSIVLKYAFNVNIPLGRIFFGIIIILLGLRLIIGHTGINKFKPHKTMNYRHGSREITVLFSNGVIDLSKYAATQKFPREISVVFGNATVIIPDSLNLEITSSTVFGSTILPDRSYAGFGEDVFIMNQNPDAPVYKVETNTVFGKLEFEIVKTPPPTTEKQDTTKTDNSF
jgi:predicted membrane protein